jgi:hypothetical protein
MYRFADGSTGNRHGGGSRCHQRVNIAAVQRPQPRQPRQLRRRAITATAARVLGQPVGVALPVQHHPPHRVVTVAAAEVAFFAVLALSGSLLAVGAMAVCTCVLGALAATNRKRVLAVTGDGVVVLVADMRGQPLAPIGQAPAGLDFPEPHGLGVPVELDDGRWWVDRLHYPRLRRALELRARRAGDDRPTGGEW